MNKRLLILSLLLSYFLIENSFSQEEKASPVVSVKFSGYIKNDFSFDSRQVYAVREGNFLLFPLQEVLDSNGSDINAVPNFNILAIETRVSANFTGPDAFGAKTSGIVEGDFFGQLNANINLLRLRHAYLKLQWQKTELLFGQYWHPLFIVSCYPTTVSFNTGTPLQPFSRAPQLRGSYMPLKNLKLSAMLVAQRDYASVGPNGNDSKYLRDAGFPEIQFQWEFNSSDSKWSCGSGFGFKQLVPQLKTYKNYQTKERVNGLSVNAFLKYKTEAITAKISAYYLENASEFLSVSGYAVKDTLDIDKGIVSYSPLRTYCLWTDIHTNGKRFQIGLFSGYTQNLGTKENVSGPIYITANANINNLYRISPRCLFISDKVTFAFETEITKANYGAPDEHAIPVNCTSVTNYRLLLSAIYKF